MLWLAHHNSEIDWRAEELKITKCPEECSKQQRLKQGKLEKVRMAKVEEKEKNKEKIKKKQKRRKTNRKVNKE